VSVDLERRRKADRDLEVSAARRLSNWLKNYRPVTGIPDELLDMMGRPRPEWLSFLGELAEYSAEDAESRFDLARRHIRDAGVTYRIFGEDVERPWPLTLLPLILNKSDWQQIVDGVEQRANLLEAVLQDVYGPRRLVASGMLPAAVVTGSVDYIGALSGVKPPGGSYLQIYAADIGRGPDGRWWVLDDRTQAPSGAGYALENRLVLSRAYPGIYKTMNVQRLAPFFDAMRKGLSAAADRAEPRICLLTPGPHSATYFEQAHLARYLGFLLVEGDDLVMRNGKVYVRTIAGVKRADVILRRVDGEYVDPLELNGESRLGVPGLLEAIRAGGVSVLNMPGSGVIESKALLGFLPALSRHLLGEELELPNVATWWCGQARERAFVEGNLDHMVVAPAFNRPVGADDGWRPSLLADMDPDLQKTVRARMINRPQDIVGQEVVRLSTTPAWRGGMLEPAPFVLRVYAARTPDGFKVMPGGFCRTSNQLDVRAISMAEEASTADVWVIDDKPVEAVSLITAEDKVRVRRITGHLPSRAADNLYWLGRYLERAEATLRLVRSISTSLVDSETVLADAQGHGDARTSLRHLLADWGALPPDEDDLNEAQAARGALVDTSAYGSVLSLVRNANRAAAGMRERLSGDFWSLLQNLEDGLAAEDGQATSEAATLQSAESALKICAALAGLIVENMNRAAGWRFLDMGRRLERGVNTCRLARTFAGSGASGEDLSVLLDQTDSQITYRARYLEGMALKPVCDMAMLDPFNPRSLAFQVNALAEHLKTLPTLRQDGIVEGPLRELLPLAAELEALDAVDLSIERIAAFEATLLRLSGAIADRFFQQGAHAAPATRLLELA
jgi:uncharacterized circularly permuted ATP-grasp superfamily protein/uncharacterized alpha-E superfamily protein